MSRLSLHRASMLAFLVVGLGPSIRAQSYAFTTVAGTSSIGDADGTGSAARFALPEGLVVDTAGNVYVADYFNSVIRKITPDGTVTTFAGQPGNFGYADGPAASARFGGLLNLAIDRSGNLYTADSYYNTVRKIAPDGRVTTIAGSPGKSGSADGTGAAALFNTPQCVAVDTVGNLYVTDTGNHTIRRIAVGGVVTTFAGDGTAGSADGSGTAAQFRSPYGIAVDPSGNIIVSDWDDCTIRKITFDGTVTTLAGLAGASGTADGTGSAARFETPAGLSVDAGGYICVAERDADDIRAISPTGVVTRLAGASNVRGYIDGTITTAQFARPTGLAVSPDNKFIYVADTDNCTVRKIDTSGNVTTFAGQPGCGWADGNGRDTRFFSPSGLALDANGNLIVADTYNHIIRQITPAGIVTTIAGGPGSPGSIDGAGPSARFRYPYGVAVDGSGNIYVADETNHTIRKITPTGVVGTLAGLALTPGSDDGAGSLARFRAPSSLVIDSAGNLIVSDSGNNTLRKVTPDGAVTTIAGLAGAAGSADGPALQARFNSPWGLAIDKAGNLYVADSGNDAIRKITPGGVVTTLAGLAGVAGSTDGTGGAARFYGPAGVAVDPDGDILVADSGNLAIRRVTPSGVVTTVGGNFHIQSADGIGSDAQFWYPSAIVTDSVGNVYVADTYNHTIRKGGLTGVAVPTSRLFNLSVRANLLASDATADHRLIVGFFVSGGTKPILVRAVGPGLAPYVGGSPVAGDPRIEIYNQATVTLEGSNDDWGGGQDLRDAFNSVGAFPLDPNSRDAASLLTISGLHSVHVLTPSAGIGLVEAYDTGSGTATRLTNISARYTVSPGTGALIAGFVITGTNQKTVLIRGVGPTLSGYGVTDALLDPRLDVYNDKQQPIAGNDNWDPSLSSSFTQVGAFPFVSGSKDAALLISLPPGLYTAQLSENGSDTGEGLIEIYDVGN